ncbi:hypothetical protein BOTCAL_0016g00190 [Botryotinia calthae]|uniref:Uncharacterized protein n=1 Tax=Botryotinia calthae TaxID=38488 RepID=A0A4Y8DI43_9HELO|nr:hypothetical protein BOTCAL_0016g00190 [Botryotinia calthae]
MLECNTEMETPRRLPSTSAHKLFFSTLGKALSASEIVPGFHCETVAFGSGHRPDITGVLDQNYNGRAPEDDH